MPNGSRPSPTDFLNAIYASAPEGAYTHLTVAGSGFKILELDAFKMPGQAGDMIARTSGYNSNADVYFTPGIVGPRWSGARTVDADVTGLCVLWADFDIADPAHKADNEVLFADVDEVRAFIADRFGLAPTALTDSGHGVHAYWVLDEAVAGVEAEVFLKRFAETFIRLGQEADRQIDNVWNPGRLMRVPGTMNRKGDPVAVMVLELNEDRRYGLDDFDQVLDEWQPPRTREVSDGHQGAPGTDFAQNANVGDVVAILEGAGMVQSGVHRNGRIDFYHSQAGSNERAVSVFPPSLDRHGQTSVAVWSSDPKVKALRLEPGNGYTAWQVLGLVKHGGDFIAAAADLRDRGYGDQAAGAEVEETGVRLPLPAGYRLWDPERDAAEHRRQLVLPDGVRHGTIGRYLDVIDGKTEADLPTVGIQLVASIGAMLGRKVRYTVSREVHHPNLFVVIVGPSSYAAKGVADNEVRRMRHFIDPDFERMHVSSGFASGENLIRRIQDMTFDKKGEPTGLGIGDQRLLIQESELASVFDIANRDGSIYGNVLRDAYDSKVLRTSSNKDDAAVSSNPHVSILGGITPEELTAKLSTLAAANGFGNRFLYSWSYSDTDLPFGADEVNDELQAIAGGIAGVIDANKRRPMLEYHLSRDGGQFTDAAKQRWYDVYADLKRPSEPGTVGMLLRRGRPIVMRIAIIYAAIDGSVNVELEHLEAGLAWFEYGRASVQRIFGDSVGVGKADEILSALRRTGEPMTLTDLSAAFNNRITKVDRDTAIDAITIRDLAVTWTGGSTGETGRRPTYVAALTPDNR